MTVSGRRRPGDARRSICSRQRVRPASSSGNSVVRSSPGQTTMASARITPSAVSSRPGVTSWTAVPRRKVTPRAASQTASAGIAVRDSTRSSCSLSSAPAIVAGGAAPSRAAAAAPSSQTQPAAMSVARNSSITAAASGRRATTISPVCSMAIPAGRAISAQTSRDRRARRHTVPASCPVTVTKPKLRIDAPLARLSRSTTTTLSPSREAASACASPTIPAPTTATSNVSSGIGPLRHPGSNGSMSQHLSAKANTLAECRS